MRLKKPCVHGRYEEHALPTEDVQIELWRANAVCPGGEFLPDDALRFKEERPICGDSQHRHLGACELYAVREGGG